MTCNTGRPWLWMGWDSRQC